MNPAYLNLAAHGPDMVAGKLVVIGSTEYRVGEQIQESNGACVYPLHNLNSGFSWFIGRFHQAKDGEDSEPFRQVDFGTFLMALSGLPVVQTETHDIPGGAVQLRRAMAAPKEDAFHRELMQKASMAMESERWTEAREIYSSVLDRNPNHHSAMVNLAGCLLYLNDPVDAMGVIVRASEVEPNDPQIHQQTAVVFRSMAMAGPAIDSLDRNLERFRWDAGSWRLKADISRQYGLVSPIEQMLAEIDDFEPNHKSALSKFIEELQSSLDEAQALAETSNVAIEKQQQGLWDDAMETWESISLQHLDSLNQLNLLISKFHLGRIDEVATQSLPLLYCLPVPLHKLTCVGLALLANTSSGAHEHALSLARLLASQVSNSADLPGTPEAVLPDGRVLESKSSQPLLAALGRLSRECSAQQDSKMLAALAELYQERERRFGNS